MAMPANHREGWRPRSRTVPDSSHDDRRAARPEQGRRPGAVALTFLAEVLVFAGLVIASYVAWTLWGTALEASRAQETHRDTLVESWDVPEAGSSSAEQGETNQRPATIVPGDALALIRIPALGADWEWVVVEGTNRDVLRQGIGHEPGTALPGKIGNLVLAGHRATYGEPFADLPDQVHDGYTIEVETRDATHTYRVTGTKETTPTDTAVMAPVPGNLGGRPKRARITLITCTPRYGSTGRWIVIGDLVESQPK